MPEQGDRKVVNGVEKYWDYEYGWLDLPKAKTPKKDKPIGRSYDPRFERNIELSEDPDLMGYGLDFSSSSYRPRRVGLDNVYPDREPSSYRSRLEGLKNAYPGRYLTEPVTEETTPKPAPAPAPEPVSVPETAVTPEDGLSEITNIFLQETPFEYDFQKVPGYRENPLTAGSMKGDHRHINPRLKAQLAVKERNERSRERKEWREVAKDIPKPTFDYRADNFNDPEIVPKDWYLKDIPNNSFINTDDYKGLF